MSNSQSQEPLGLTAYNLSPRKVTKFLLSIIALLILLNVGERVIVHWLNAQNNGQLISKYFNFDQEANLPSLFSGSLLVFCSYLLGIIATIKKNIKGKYAKHWKALSFIFLYLSVDEFCSIHELLIPILRGVVNDQGFLYFPWVIPGFCLVIMFLIVFRKFILSLPNQTKFLFVLAGAIYLFGVLGMESVGGYIADNYGYGMIYGVASTIEELLEMFGVVLFINALLNYLQAQVLKLQFSLSFQPEKVNQVNYKK